MNAWCTIVVPTYNGQRYLRELISSLLRSSTDGCRYLFIDDASTDHSIEIIMSSGLPRTQFLYNERNIGLYPTINKALNNVETDYISLVFQDDVIEDNYLAQMKHLTAAYPQASFLWSEITIIDETGKDRTVGLDTGRVEVIPPGVPAWRSGITRGTFWTISGSLSKTTRLRHYGFRTDLPHCADYDFLLRSIRKDTFLYIERPLVKIRTHSEQASARHLASALDLSEKMMIYLDQRIKYKNDFDLSLRLSTFLRQSRRAVRRALGQAIRGNLRQACSTLLLLPHMVHLAFRRVGRNCSD